MGYTEATIIGTTFRLPADRGAGALAWVRAWLAADLGYDLDVLTLAAAFKLFGITAIVDDGDIVDLEFDGVLVAETDDLFEGLAPYVEPQSIVDWRGGRGNTWRYEFRGGRLHRTDVV